MNDLIKRLREDAGFDGQKLLAADALEAANERIAALTVKCGLLAASLDKADLEVDALKADAAIGRIVLSKTIILDGSTEGMTILTLAADAKGLLEYATRKAIKALSATKEQG